MQNNNHSIQVVILAAGLGKRMQSKLPKVLHRLAGKPILEHIVETAKKISQKEKPLVIVGHEREKIQTTLQQYDVEWIEQTQQFGTGHAVLQTLPFLKDNAQVLILCGDVPLISEDSLRNFIATTSPRHVGMLTAILDNPAGYGRILRDAQQHVVRIIEEKDASESEKKISEINTGIYFLPSVLLKKWLPILQNNNKQQEYYLTDIISFAVAENIPISTSKPQAVQEILGVNDRYQLHELERYYQYLQAKYWMSQGVSIIDAARFDLRGNANIARDVVIDVNVILEGQIEIGEGCQIDANVYLKDVILGKGVQIKANSFVEGATIADECIIGPFARVRPSTQLAKTVHIGNFVEVKNSNIGMETKINHLSYIGDSDIGQFVNIGAGTITCNYDGVTKHKTTIEDNVHIGSDTQLVAPVTIGEGATIGAGSTIIKNVPSYQLTLSHHLDQRTLEGWIRPQKAKKSF